MIQSVDRLPSSGVELATQGEAEGLNQFKCYRCHRNPKIAHDGNFFCPAFADMAEAGEWISFNRIHRALSKAAGTILSIQFAGLCEEPEGPFKTHHKILGMGHKNQYFGRFDSPSMPEFSVWRPSQETYDPTHGHIMRRRSTHTQLYKGWRAALRDAAAKLGVPFRKIARDLGVSPDWTSEEIARFKVGWK